MKIARTLPELNEALTGLSATSLVPTMGALHDGHVSLLSAAKAAGRPVIASIFVNPTQFGPKEDFSQYPRDEAGDLATLEATGCDLVWLPEAAAMYPAGSATTITVARPALRWEGASRPGHFAGVATVVAKLFGQIRPAAAYFGEKDWQQIQVIRRMVSDLLLPVQIVPVPTIREADGLALSSRNRFLAPPERKAATALFASLTRAAKHIAAGKEPAATLHLARQELAKAGMIPDYIALVDAESLEPVATLTQPARLIAAVKLGRVRLLDNVPVF